MPPKKTSSGASKKAEVKKKEKIIEVSEKCTKFIRNKAKPFSIPTFSYLFFCQIGQNVRIEKQERRQKSEIHCPSREASQERWTTSLTACQCEER